VNPVTLSKLKIAGAVLFFGVMGWLLVSEFRGRGRRGDHTAIVWFYDESEKELYPMPVNTIPPDKGIGGPSDDGYRAIVVGFAGYKHDKSKRKIAYLEKYAPDLKQTLEGVMMARAAGRIFSGPVPSPQSEDFLNNTLVKQQNEADWHAANSKEGRLIMKEWRSWRGPDGSGPAICAVD
jgi:hypothetical protein